MLSLPHRCVDPKSFSAVAAVIPSLSKLFASSLGTSA